MALLTHFASPSPSALYKFARLWIGEEKLMNAATGAPEDLTSAQALQLEQELVKLVPDRRGEEAQTQELKGAPAASIPTSTQTPTPTQMPKCPLCGSSSFTASPERGEVACARCGLVVEERTIDLGPNQRAYTPEDRYSRRTGPPTTFTLHDKGLTTTISRQDRDAHGRSLGYRRRLEAVRLRRWQTSTRAHKSLERNLARAMSVLERISSQMALPRSVKEEAAAMYRRAVREGFMKGRPTEQVVAATVYAACRMRRIPRTLAEIAERTGIKRKEIALRYNQLVMEMSVNVPAADPLNFVSRIGCALGLSGRAQCRAAEIIREAKNAKNSSMGGRSPAALAAGAVYLASLIENEPRNQGDVAAAATVSEPTVRVCYRELVRRLGIDYDALKTRALTSKLKEGKVR
jgi:transcription initiation factor TFIIB